MLFSILAFANAESQQSGGDPYFYDKMLANGILLFSGLAILASMVALYRLVNVMIQVQQIRIYEEQGFEAFKKVAEAPKEPMWKRLYKKWTNVVPVEKEEDILMHHEYDGIRELDNSLPPWWVALFYITIIFGAGWVFYYHISDYGPSQIEAYEQEMKDAEEAVQAYLSKQANLVDETNVTPLEDETALAAGETIFKANCAACHGQLGEGGVGPNLTDAYWIHGGSIKDVFKTVKYGVPEKGMISWKSQLSAGDMHKVSSYIMTLVGTTPPNGKAPQGDLYEPEPATATTDSTDNKTLGMIMDK